MTEWFLEIEPAVQALLAGVATWLATTLGASLVVFIRRMGPRLLVSMLGFAAGIMVAASVFSLLLPSIEMAEASNTPGWLPAVVGFLLGAATLRGTDLVLARFSRTGDLVTAATTSRRRTTLLVTAITLHNIPEGLAIGVAFGAAGAAVDAVPLANGPSIAAAVALALGIAIQNIPEGAAVAIPLRAQGFTRARAFCYGQLSGLVEPPAAMLGAAAVLTAGPLLPYALSFAAGAMMFVVIEELIPTSQADGRHHDVATLAAMVGFAIMMTLDVALA